MCLTAAAAPLACGAGNLTPLPLDGRTPAGKRFRVEASRPSDPRVKHSWCLALGFQTDTVVVGHGPFGGGVSECGRDPAPRVSGVIQLDCARRTLFVFGGARSGVGPLELLPRRGPRVRARRASLPPRSGFDGTTFVAVTGTRGLPARLRAGGRDVARVPAFGVVCRRPPGQSLEGVQPFAEFP